MATWRRIPWRSARRNSFQRLHGQYSRWGFSHPGPGWFYAMAAGEAIFHDQLRATPTPWNAQLLVVLLVNSAFLAAAIGIVAREVAAADRETNGRPRPGWLAATAAGAGLVVTVLHLAALGQAAGLLHNWTAYLTVIPFCCLHRRGGFRGRRARAGLADSGAGRGGAAAQPRRAAALRAAAHRAGLGRAVVAANGDARGAPFRARTSSRWPWRSWRPCPW